ncbi:MAG: hypothetical protein ACQETH_16970 [Candidatus Rifleibacteriota bacterium]
MIKTNLIKRDGISGVQARKTAVFLLSLLLIVQLVFLGFKYHAVTRSRQEYKKKEAKLTRLSAEAEKYQLKEDIAKLAGKLAARNNWLNEKKNSPLNRLGKIQDDCPTNVNFLVYEADLNQTEILLTAPNLNLVSGWLNRHFNHNGNISVAGREKNLLKIRFLWSK